MKPIYKSLLIEAAILSFSLSLQAQVTSGEEVTTQDVQAGDLEGLKVVLISPNVSGAKDLIASGECELDGANIIINLQNLAQGIHRVQVSAVFGTQTCVIYALDLTVPAGALASEPQEFDDEVIVVSTIGDGQGEKDLKSAVSITYEQLVALRDSGKLVAGQTYRITDYVTTTAADNTQSAGHVFDIIVTALSESVLSEEANAIQHEADTYFADCNLSAWKVMYCLDNDTKRFAWADEENGKGVIFRLIDEWRNDLPFDFKNIKFKRWAISGISHEVESYDTSSLEEAFVYNSESQPIRYGLKGENYQNGRVTFEVEEETDADYYYAFSWIDEQGVILDLSIVGQTLKNNEGLIVGCTDNYCATQYKSSLEEGEAIEALTAVLPNNVIVNTFVYEDGLFYGCYYNTFGNYCYSNTFGNDCYSNTFGNDCNYNTFGNDCNSNTFGNYCNSNTFGNGCYSNTFGNDCNSNTFGNGCNYNTFGNDCNYNTFGNYCYSNTFGNDCNYNTFGNGCNSNTFGNYCNSNTFGNYCNSNTFGEGCYYNTFGNGCNSNTFGNSCNSNTFGNDCNSNTFGNGCNSNTFDNDCNSNTFGEGCYYNTFGNDCNSNTFGEGAQNDAVTKDFMRYITLEPGVQYVDITCADTTSDSAYGQNILVHSGVIGTDNARKTCSIDDAGNDFLTEFGVVQQGVVS